MLVKFGVSCVNQSELLLYLHEQQQQEKCQHKKLKTTLLELCRQNLSGTKRIVLY